MAVQHVTGRAMVSSNNTALLCACRSLYAWYMHVQCMVDACTLHVHVQSLHALSCMDIALIILLYR